MRSVNQKFKGLFRSMVHGLLSMVIFCILVSPAIAAFSDISRTFLRTEYGARPLAMGKAFVGVVDDPNSVFYNPAGVAFADGFIASSDQNLNQLSASYVYSLGDYSGIGLGLISNKINNFSVSSGNTASINAEMIMLAYGVRLNSSLGVGINLKSLQRENYQEGLVYESISGMDADVGIIWKVNEWLNAGIDAINILQSDLSKWPTGSEKDQICTKVGLAANLMGDIRSPIYIEDRNLLLTTDLELRQNSPILHLGGEFAIGKGLFLRAGLEPAGLSFGLGGRFGKFGIDLTSAFEELTNNREFYLSLCYFPHEWDFIKKGLPLWATKGQLISELSLVDNTVTYDEYIKVQGKVNPGVGLKINSNPVFISASGDFHYQLPLRPGKNLVVVDANYQGINKSYHYKILRKAKVIIAEERIITAKIATAEGAEKKILEKERKKVEEKKQKLEVLVTMGVVEVKPNTEFKLEAVITRGELASWIVRAGHLPLSPVAGDVCKDVSKNNPLAYYIKTVIDQHIMSTFPDGTFRPNQPVTEAEGKEIFKRFGIIK